MSDLRKDPITGRWVIIAKNRGRRPHDFEPAPRRRQASFCPFCEGSESNTPGEVFAFRHAGSAPNGRGWRVRVVPNKFPALEIEDDLRCSPEGFYETMGGVGAHEVIIESPEHLVSTAELSDEQLGEVLLAYRERLVELRKDSRLVYGMIFKNAGAAAGASLEHTHSQLIATPILPSSVQEEISGSLEFFQREKRCVWCAMIQHEVSVRQRIAIETDGFLAFCPFAGRFPFEIWVLPKAHTSHFESIDDADLAELAHLMRQTIGNLETALEKPAYNYLLHTAPFDTEQLDHYHWHIEVFPRLTKTAGFEWGTGYYINPVPPEEAAEFLRDVGGPDDAENIMSRKTS